MVDEKDIKIVEILRTNARLTTKQISKKTLLPITTVHNRIKKLENLGIIKHYSAIIDYKKLGKAITAYILMSIDYIYLKEKNITQHELAKKISMHPLVQEANMVTGNTDMILKIVVNDINQLDEFVTKYLRNLEGIQRTHTMIVLSEF